MCSGREEGVTYLFIAEFNFFEEVGKTGLKFRELGLERLRT